MFDATNQCLIHFDDTRQRSTLSTHHRHAKPLQQRPGHPVTNAQGSLQALGGEAVLGRSHMPGRFEPNGQWGTGLLKDHPDRNGRLVPTRATDESPSAFAPGLSNDPACWTREPVRPSQGFEKLCTRRIFVKPGSKFTIGPRVIATGKKCHQHKNRIGWGSTQHLASGGANRPPPLRLLSIRRLKPPALAGQL